MCSGPRVHPALIDPNAGAERLPDLSARPAGPNVIGEGLEHRTIDRAHAAAIEFDGVRVLQTQQRACRHVAHRAGGRRNLRL